MCSPDGPATTQVGAPGAAIEYEGISAVRRSRQCPLSGNLSGRAEWPLLAVNGSTSKRGSDPEGRYWLAVALQKSGDADQMRMQLNTILEQARSNPRFFRKENREWIYKARSLLRNSKFQIPDSKSI